jgi:endonuclease IV
VCQKANLKKKRVKHQVHHASYIITSFRTSSQSITSSKICLLNYITMLASLEASNIVYIYVYF